MSAGPVEGSGLKGKASQDFELNLASIIDCFTVLITFMLASASFISIGILDAGIAAAGTEANPGTPPPVNIILELGREHQLTVKITGKANSTTPIPQKNGAWDYETLTSNLKNFKSKWPEVNALTLSADGKVEYKDVVKTMDLARQSLPVVLLDGF